MVKEYLSKYHENFIRKVPKLKKRMSKFEKIKLQMEDLELEHKEVLENLKKDFEKQLSTSKEELEQVREDYATLLFRAKIIGCVLLLIILLVLFI